MSALMKFYECHVYKASSTHMRSCEWVLAGSHQNNLEPFNVCNYQLLLQWILLGWFGLCDWPSVEYLVLLSTFVVTTLLQSIWCGCSSERTAKRCITDYVPRTCEALSKVQYYWLGPLRAVPAFNPFHSSSCLICVCSLAVSELCLLFLYRILQASLQ